MYHITVNNKFKFDIESGKGTLLVNGSKSVADVQQLNERTFHVLDHNRSYTAELVSIDRENKTCVIKVNQTKYSIELKDQYDDLLRSLGLDNLNTKKVNEIKAPMPGLVIRILVEDGQAISKGDSLLVLEAMKMENIIKAPADGVIKQIRIKASDKVEKNEVMISLE